MMITNIITANMALMISKINCYDFLASLPGSCHTKHVGPVNKSYHIFTQPKTEVFKETHKNVYPCIGTNDGL